MLSVCSFREYEKSCKVGVLHIHEDSNTVVYAFIVQKLFLTKKSPRTSSIGQVIFSFWAFEISEGILRNQKFIIG